MKHNIFVYGTLRPGTGPTARLVGEMYDLGWFPGVKLGVSGCNSSFVVECIEVSSEKLTEIDGYEGYHEDNKPHSLYLRKEIECVIGGKTVAGWIYVYNDSIEPYKFIESGDWLVYTNSPKGFKSSFVDSPKSKPVVKAPEPVREPVFDGERAAR